MRQAKQRPRRAVLFRIQDNYAVLAETRERVDLFGRANIDVEDDSAGILGNARHVTNRGVNSQPPMVTAPLSDAFDITQGFRRETWEIERRKLSESSEPVYDHAEHRSARQHLPLRLSRRRDPSSKIRLGLLKFIRVRHIEVGLFHPEGGAKRLTNLIAGLFHSVFERSNEAIGHTYLIRQLALG